MSMLGGFLQGLGAGVGTVGQAGMQYAQEMQRSAARRQEKDEDFEREKQMMLERIKANRQAQADIRSDELAFNTDPANVEARAGAASATAKAAARTATDIEMEQLGNQSLQDARRGKAKKDAEFAAQTELDILKLRAADKEGLKAAETIKLNDPEIRARIEQARAAAGASAANAAESRARTGMINVQRQGAEIAVKDQGKLSELYAQADAVLADSSITDQERTKRFTDLQRQITLMKAARGQVEKPPPQATEEVVTEFGPDGKPMGSKRTVKGPAGSGSDRAPYPDGTELRGRDGKTYVVQGGQPVLKGGNAAPRAQQEPEEVRMARVVERMNDEQFAAYKKMQENQPLSPRERNLLRDAGVLK